MWSDQRLWHGKHPEHHQGLWIPALPHAGQPGAPLPAPPPARHTARWEGEEECPERAMWEGQQGGLQPQQDLPVDTAAGAAPAGQGGEHAETGCWWYTQAWGLQPLGFINLPELLAFPCITCLREAGSGQDGYSTGAA